MKFDTSIVRLKRACTSTLVPANNRAEATTSIQTLPVNIRVNNTEARKIDG